MQPGKSPLNSLLFHRKAFDRSACLPIWPGFVLHRVHLSGAEIVSEIKLHRQADTLQAGPKLRRAMVRAAQT